MKMVAHVFKNTVYDAQLLDTSQYSSIHRNLFGDMHNGRHPCYYW